MVQSTRINWTEIATSRTGVTAVFCGCIITLVALSLLRELRPGEPLPCSNEDPEPPEAQSTEAMCEQAPMMARDEHVTIFDKRFRLVSDGLHCYIEHVHEHDEICEGRDDKDCHHTSTLRLGEAPCYFLRWRYEPFFHRLGNGEAFGVRGGPWGMRYGGRVEVQVVGGKHDTQHGECPEGCGIWTVPVFLDNVFGLSQGSVERHHGCAKQRRDKQD